MEDDIIKEIQVRILFIFLTCNIFILTNMRNKCQFVCTDLSSEYFRVCYYLMNLRVYLQVKLNHYRPKYHKLSTNCLVSLNIFRLAFIWIKHCESLGLHSVNVRFLFCAFVSLVQLGRNLYALF